MQKDEFQRTEESRFVEICIHRLLRGGKYLRQIYEPHPLTF